MLSLLIARSPSNIYIVLDVTHDIASMMNNLINFSEHEVSI